MGVEIKYYKITNPQTGEVSREIGYIHTRQVRDYKARIVNGERQVLKNETYEKVTNRLIDVAGAEEITKEEFDSLNIKNESVAVQRKREHLLRRVDRFNEQEVLKNATPEQRHVLRQQAKDKRVYKQTERLERKAK